MSSGHPKVLSEQDAEEDAEDWTDCKSEASSD